MSSQWWTPTISDYLVPKQSEACVSDLRASQGVSELAVKLETYVTERFLAQFTPAAREVFNREAPIASAQLAAFKNGGNRLRSCLWAIPGFGLPFMIIFELWWIGEDVFVLRNLFYLILFALIQLRFVFGKHTTPQAYRQLDIDWITTLVVPTTLFFFIAFIPGCRGWYRAVWFTVTNITLTAIALYFIVFDPLRKRYSERRTVRLEADGIFMAEVAVEAVLDEYRQFALHQHAYITTADRYETDVLTTTIDSLMRKSLAAIKKNFEDSLPPGKVDAMLARLPPDDPLVVASLAASAANALAAAIKWIGTAIATIIQIGITASLYKTPGSLAQSVVFSLNVCGQCAIMAWEDSYTVKAFFDYFNPKALGNILAVCVVSVPFLTIENVYDNPKIFGGSLLAMAFCVFVLTSPLGALLKKLSAYLTRPKLRRTPEAGDLPPTTSIVASSTQTQPQGPSKERVSYVQESGEDCVGGRFSEGDLLG